MVVWGYPIPRHGRVRPQPRIEPNVVSAMWHIGGIYLTGVLFWLFACRYLFNWCFMLAMCLWVFIELVFYFGYGHVGIYLIGGLFWLCASRKGPRRNTSLTSTKSTPPKL